MAPTQPTPQTYTLRLKNHRSTTLLHVDPLQSFSSIKSELLRALHETHTSSHLPSGSSIPSTPSDVIFAEPLDIHDLSKGWKRVGGDRLNDPDDDVLGDALAADARAGRKAGKASGKGKVRDDCPMGVGLKDGAVLAYKFRSDVVDGDEELGIKDEGDEVWDVVLPSYEEGPEEEGR